MLYCIVCIVVSYIMIHDIILYYVIHYIYTNRMFGLLIVLKFTGPTWTASLGQVE